MSALAGGAAVAYHPFGSALLWPLDSQPNSLSARPPGLRFARLTLATVPQRGPGTTDPVRNSVMRPIVVGILLVIALPAVAGEPKPPMLTPEQQRLADEATRLSAEGNRLYQAGRYADAAASLRRALDIR